MSKLLSFDLSTHTGWAYFENGVLRQAGHFDVPVDGYVSIVKTYLDLPPIYPLNMMDTSIKIAYKCIEIWEHFGRPDIVTEHTEGSKHRISQRLLEFIHYAFFLHLLPEGANIKYLLNSDWRRSTKCYVSQWPEMVKYNKEVAKAKKKAKPNKAGARVAKIDGKIVSRWDQKKLSIHIAKLDYPGLADTITTDDVADAINMGTAAIRLGLF